jgi:NAD(P)-dependent dehydrogenase (short-subunit alcohol dehydrogenase family)
MTHTLESQSQPANPPATDKLAGRVAFITGGTRGIGAAIAHSLANQGATVAVGNSRNPQSAKQFVDDLMSTTRRHGASASAHQGNVGSADDCRRTVAEVIDAHGRLDILVNNAGITMDKTVAAMTEEDKYTVLAVNLSGAFFMSQAALDHMAQRGSGRTDDGIGITVNTVTPGLIATEMTAAIPEKVMAKLTGQIPVGRAGRPEEVARPGPFPCCRRLLVYHRAGVERQRWHGHVKACRRSRPRWRLDRR